MELLHLAGTKVSAVLEIASASPPLWRYWGPRLPQGAAPSAALAEGRGPSAFSLAVDRPLSLFPTFGLGDFNEPALLADRDGRDFAQSFTEVEIERRPPAGAGVRLRDPIAGIAVSIILELDPNTDVLAISTCLTNQGETPLRVHLLVSGVTPLPASRAIVRFPTGWHGAEFALADQPLGGASWRRDNRRGITSHDSFPAALVLTAGAGEASGLVFGAQLAWSGNSMQTIAPCDDGRRQWSLGEWLAPGEVILGAGETLRTPAMLATCSSEGCNGVARNFHRHIRRRLAWPEPASKKPAGSGPSPRPVHFNTWESVYFNLDLGILSELAVAAAALGVERFVLDDGWFVGRRDDTRALGDWRADPTIFPDGLAPLARKVESLGMEFGLWVEPEMVSPDSDLFRAHPDWALGLVGRTPLLGRHQLVLDLTRAEVFDYLLGALTTLLDGVPATYLKWDHNRDLAAAASAERPAYRRQALAAWALMDALRQRFPRLEIESCAGGGGRADAGVLEHAHRVWASDNLDALSRLNLQQGLLHFLPPEVIGAHVGSSPAHSTGRVQSMSFRCAVAVTAHFGVELDPRKLAESERQVLSCWIEFYKAWRDLLHGGELWQGGSGEEIVWQAHGSCKRFLLFLYRLAAPTRRWSSAVPLPFLDTDARYRITRLDIDPAMRRRAERTGWRDPVRGEHAGSWLRTLGLDAPVMAPQSCLVYEGAAV